MTAAPLPCEPWCATTTPPRAWAEKCQWQRCRGCQPCLLLSPPHVLLINADDVGVGDVSHMGWPTTLVATPNIDRLAREGTAFTNMHAGAPLCAPSRYSILTGNLPARGENFFGTWSVGLRTQVRPEQLTTGHLFRQARRATHTVAVRGAA